MIINSIFSEMINAPVRQFAGRVELYEGSTLTLTCGCHDRLKDFVVERIGEGSKFFGFGISQKLTVHLLDKDRELSPKVGTILEAVFGVGSDYIYPFPKFFVTEISRDENTNELTLIAYDSLYPAIKTKVSELDLQIPYTLRAFVVAAAASLGLPYHFENVDEAAFDLLFEEGANFDGSENLREALNDIAEITQTIYYIDRNWELVFKGLDKTGEAPLTIDKEKYFTLDTSASRTLTSLVHATELGDNLIASIGEDGITQYIRDNAFWTLREDTASLLDAALARIGGISAVPFNCRWRGNFLAEIGDKIALTTKDDNVVYSYLLNDAITFNGALSAVTQWVYTDNSMETDTNPTNLGEALNQTFAKVDKVNKQIDLVVSQVEGNSSAISQLRLTTDEINASVQETTEAINGVNEEVATLTNKVEAAMTAEDVRIEISTALQDGVERVETTTGFTFNEEGLTVSKSGSEIKTTITEDGMTVYRNEEAVLVADNEGVKAEDLHATTYLIIGTNSRFEDYNSRTGCFWIGG